jgi:hypothetical protein
MKRDIDNQDGIEESRNMKNETLTISHEITRSPEEGGWVLTAMLCTRGQGTHTEDPDHPWDEYFPSGDILREYAQIFATRSAAVEQLNFLRASWPATLEQYEAQQREENAAKRAYIAECERRERDRQAAVAGVEAARTLGSAKVYRELGPQNGGGRVFVREFVGADAQDKAQEFCRSANTPNNLRYGKFVAA